MEKFTKIVCTIGPASDDEKILRKLYDSGMNVARLNFSHGQYEYFEKVIPKIRSISNEIAILLDTKGPEIRTGVILGGQITLVDGEFINLTKKEVIGDLNEITVNYKYLNQLEIGNRLLIDDGLIELKIVQKEDSALKAKVLNGGVLGSKKSVTILGHDVNLPFLSKKDISDIEFGIKHDVDFIAASFVRKAKDVESLRKLLDKNNSKIKIISKIEHADAVKNFEEILDGSDGVMIARGDLGVEVPIEKVPQYQRDMIKISREKGKPVIVATQMLESMKSNPRPTRAEVNDVALAIVQGTDAIMLSGETANGRYPVKSVEMMNKIAKEYEQKTNNSIIEDLKHVNKIKKSISLFITKTAFYASRDLDAKAIFTPTESGFTARNISRFRPQCPIYALIQDEKLLRQLQLTRGVFPVLYKDDFYLKIDKMVKDLISKLHKKNILNYEDKVIVTAGFKIAEKGHTNMIEIYKVDRILE